MQLQRPFNPSQSAGYRRGPTHANRPPRGTAATIMLVATLCVVLISASAPRSPSWTTRVLDPAAPADRAPSITEHGVRTRRRAIRPRAKNVQASTDD